MGWFRSSLFKHGIEQVILLLTILSQIQFDSSVFSSFQEFRLLDQQHEYLGLYIWNDKGSHPQLLRTVYPKLLEIPWIHLWRKHDFQKKIH